MLEVRKMQYKCRINKARMKRYLETCLKRMIMIFLLNYNLPLNYKQKNLRIKMDRIEKTNKNLTRTKAIRLIVARTKAIRLIVARTKAIRLIVARTRAGRRMTMTYLLNYRFRNYLQKKVIGLKNSNE